MLASLGPKQGKTSAVAGGTYYAGEVQALTKEITDLKLSVDLLEKERDFYFGKLRDIEGIDSLDITPTSSPTPGAAQ
ncbi:hypothetical protein ACLB2K_066984 [Fragaria x ananassa]